MEIDLAGSFMQGVQIAVDLVLSSLLANPWLAVMFGGLIVAAAVMRLAPNRRRRRAR